MNMIIDFINEAIKEAKKAYKKGEVPVGAVIFKENKLISKAHNLVETKNSSINHAEILAIKKAISFLKRKRLDDCSLISTLEPCAMCAGAIVLARIKHLFILAKDEKTGACGSLLNVIPNSKLNHTPVVEFIYNNQYEMMLKIFFSQLRKIK